MSLRHLFGAMQTPYAPRLAEVGTNGWAGQLWHPVVVVDETPKRYRIKTRDGKAYTFAANRKLAQGESMLVPKRAVRFVHSAQGERNDAG